MRTDENSTAKTTPWFDPFTLWMLIIMFAILTAIFIAAKYMGMHEMTGAGTDDAVNALASQAANVKSHPFIELPGDAEVGAFTVAGFFAGMIVGHNWKKLFEQETE